MDTYILIDGVPVPEPDLRKWGEWMQATDLRVDFTPIAYGEDGDTSIYVSTVFLGLDQNIRWEGGMDDGLDARVPPVILFETMIMGGPSECQRWQYATIQGARKGHNRAVIAARRSLRTLQRER